MKDYRIKLAYNLGVYTERLTNAKFGEDVLLDIQREGVEQYYRKSLSGKFTFCNEDYDFIMDRAIDTRFSFIIERAEGGSIWMQYFLGYFYRIDCEIDADRKIITVTPTADDKLTEFLGNLDKEYDLLKLAPAITPVMLDVRPCLQIYAAGTETIGCFLSNMFWEQECNSVTDESELLNTYHFALWSHFATVTVGGTHTPDIPEVFYGSSSNKNYFVLRSGQFSLTVSYLNGTLAATINRGDTLLFNGQESVAEITYPRSLTLTAWADGATGTCELLIDIKSFYARTICDVDRLLGIQTELIPYDDICPNNRNYKRVAPTPQEDDLNIIMNTQLSAVPTEWGLYQPNQYYTEPAGTTYENFPVCRNIWGRSSYWITQGNRLKLADKYGRNTRTLKDSYKLTDVINALLNAQGQGLSLVSDFLDGTNPLITGDDGILYLTPKSNVLNINYTEPAQKAPITMRQVLEMLRIAYRCFWELTPGSQLRIEHVQYFRNGGSYNGLPSVEVDLTAYNTVRNGKRWSYLTSQYKYDKAEIPCRYEFGWQDDCTEPFKGNPIEMQSGFVNQAKTEQFVANGFSTDIDYLMLNPNGVSKDGFVLLKADTENTISTPLQVSGSAGQWGTLMLYATNAPETVDVVYSCRGDGEVWAMDANNNAIKQIDSWNTVSAGDDISYHWDLPAGTAKIVVVLTTDGYFTLTELYGRYLKVIYYDWNISGSTIQQLQNGRLSFEYLQRYYAYDMPCRYYQIDGATYVAQGVSKNKVQEITLPTDGEVDTKKVITTNLGNGKVRKISINLSSKFAEATLEYDTEQ